MGSSLVLEEADFARYIAPRISRAEIRPEQRVMVNSIPKSGTVWLVAMLASVLNVCPNRQIILSHVNDIREDDAFKNVLGAVVVVRDLRDVVVSWHHALARADLRAGFSGPRYPTVAAFYFEHLIGFLRTSPRYAHGCLEDWLDFVTARAFPLIRYEDMLADPSAALTKVLRFWKVEVPATDIAATAEAHAFARMPRTVAETPGRVRDMVADGHLRRGLAGIWRDELPSSVQSDIAERFGGFQARLGYT